MNDIKILCIDDNDEIRFTLGAIIETNDWIPILAKDVKEGIDFYKKYNPTLVIMDYHLPRENGIIGVKKIRNINKNIPIIVLTVANDKNVAKKFMEAGAVDFALKPIKALDLISRINLNLRLIDKMDKDQDNQFIAKGISKNTLDLVLSTLETHEEINIEDIEVMTNLAYQTVSRYLQFLENEDLVEVSLSYGKIGRPKKYYKLK